MLPNATMVAITNRIQQAVSSMGSTPRRCYCGRFAMWGLLPRLCTFYCSEHKPDGLVEAVRLFVHGGCSSGDCVQITEYSVNGQPICTACMDQCLMQVDDHERFVECEAEFCHEVATYLAPDGHRKLCKGCCQSLEDCQELATDKGLSRFGFVSYKDDSQAFQQSPRVVVQAESLHLLRSRLRIGAFDLVIMDEARSTLGQMLSYSTHGSNWGRNLNVLVKMCRSSRVLCIDDHLTIDRMVELFIRKIIRVPAPCVRFIKYSHRIVPRSFRVVPDEVVTAAALDLARSRCYFLFG